MINVVDGDTVDVVSAGPRRQSKVTRVRLWGIDAPEREQPLGPQATRALGKLLRDGSGVLRMEVFAYDRYARAIALLYWEKDGRGRSINRAMVRLGMAYVFRRPQGAYFRKLLGFEEAEALARNSRDGVWGVSGGERQPPWDYRSRQRQPESAGCLGAFVHLMFPLLALTFSASVFIGSGLPARFIR